MQELSQLCFLLLKYFCDSRWQIEDITRSHQHLKNPAAIRPLREYFPPDLLTKEPKRGEVAAQ